MTSQVNGLTKLGDGIFFRKGGSEAPGLDLKVIQIDKGSRQCLKEIMLKAGVEKIIITSAYRDAVGQASAMYDNLTAGFPAAPGLAQQAVN